MTTAEVLAQVAADRAASQYGRHACRWGATTTARMERLRGEWNLSRPYNDAGRHRA